MIFNGDKRFRKKLQKFLEKIQPIDKSIKERCKYRVQIYGEEMNDLAPGEPVKVFMSRDEYFETQEEAEALGKLEYANGKEVEIWYLIKRWI